MTRTDDNRLAHRYGRQPRSKIVVVAIGLLATLGIAWLAWVVTYYARPMVQSGLVGFEVTGKHTAQGTVTIQRRDRDVDASCLLRAYAPDHTIVGELNFDVTATAPADMTVTKRLRTERKATSVTIVGCRAEGQVRWR